MKSKENRKAFVATFYLNNYGSALQAFSLQKVLEEIGFEPYVLKQKLPPDNRNFLEKLFGKAISFVKLLKPQKHYGVLKRLRMIFERGVFKEKNSKISKFCLDNFEFEEVDAVNNQFKYQDNESLYLVGSDQVWNIIDHNINPFYKLAFVNNKDCKKFSYAASIGLENLTSDQVEYYVEELKDFETVSVREKSSYLALANTSLQNKLRIDIDPTLLHDGNFWSRIAGDKIESDYIFIYMLRPNQEIFDMAKKLANDKGLKIIYTGTFAYKVKGIQTINTAGVEEFLSLVEHAKYVITNSFHGTCFSVLFNKPFVSVRVASTGARAETLLEALDLKCQLISSINEITKIENIINYDEVNKKLDLMRKDSLRYLTSLYGNEEN